MLINATELSVDRPGLFGKVITVVDAPSGHEKIEFEILNAADTMDSHESLMIAS